MVADTRNANNKSFKCVRIALSQKKCNILAQVDFDPAHVVYGMGQELLF